MQMRTVIPNNS